jgi:osmotically inducible protein OsmC
VRRTAEVTWEGNVARGKGAISGESGAFTSLPYSEPARIGPPEENTSPEELLAAAHGGCYAMSLAAELTKAGTPPERLRVRATCTLDKVEGAGHRVVAVELEARARVQGIGEAEFRRLAEAADQGCTFSHLVKASAEVTLDARLEEDH